MGHQELKFNLKVIARTLIVLDSTSTFVVEMLGREIHVRPALYQKSKTSKVYEKQNFVLRKNM